MGAQSIYTDDNGKVRLGTGDDFQIYHDGNNSYVNSSTGDLYIQSISGGDDIYLWSQDDIYLMPQNGENGIKILGDGTVELYYDGTKKFSTISNGAQVHGSFYLDNDHNIQLNDTNKLVCGDGGDLQIYHSGTKSYIKDAGTGSLRINSDNFRIYNAADSELMIYAEENANVTLYYDGVNKLQTGSGGIIVSGNYYTNDSNKIYLGSDNDLEIYHTGSNAIIANGTGSLELKSTNTINLKVNNGTEYGVSADSNGGVELYYDNSVKLATSGSGVTVTGSVTTNDINMSNLNALPNEVDGTKGSWTIQEGADDLFLINRSNGKKYKFNLTEVS